MYWDFSFHFEKSSWNSFTLRFIGDQPFILQSAVFRHDTCSNNFFYLSKYEMVKAVHFTRDVLSICQVICKRLGSVSTLLTTDAWYETVCHLGFDITAVESNHINILIPYYILSSTAFQNRHGNLYLEELWWIDMQQHRHMFLPSVVLLWFDKQVDSSVAADTHHFLLSSSVRLIRTSSLRWPAAIFSTECFLLVMTEDKRGLNIRSISMDFRFESPGERWALWKDSERATKGKTSKHQRKKKINPIWFMVQGYVFFSGYT